MNERTGEEDMYFWLEWFNIRDEWDYWANRPVLLADEAIPLMHGVDPKSWQEHQCNEKGLPDDMVQSIKRQLKIAENVGHNQASPAEWLKWGCEHKLNEHTLKPDYAMNTGEVCFWHLFEDAVNGILTNGAESLNESESAMVDDDNEVAGYFDPVSHETLSAMFPSKNDSWVKWHRKAKDCGLKNARQGRGKYNPYLAAMWWFKTYRHKPKDLTLDGVYKKLGENLPLRNKHLEYLFGVDSK